MTYAHAALLAFFLLAALAYACLWDGAEGVR